MIPASAQIPPIVVTTDKLSYSDGDIIIVSGEVSDILSGMPITLQVIAPNGNIVALQQFDVSFDKTFGTEITAGGKLMKQEGTYIIKVQYGTDKRTAESTFEFGTSVGTGTTQQTSGPSINVEGFSVGYQITGGSVLSVIPDVDASSLIIEISATDDGELIIVLPRALIDSTIGDADDDFFVLVDGEEVDFDETKTDSDRTLTISFSVGSEEIEIIGTFVIPEFGTIAALILAVAIISIIAVTAKTRLSLIPRY